MYRLLYAGVSWMCAVCPAAYFVLMCVAGCGNEQGW
jgi:hypothetical protein